MADHFIVTGCAGFIGSNLVDRLLSNGCTVTGVDNFSTGQHRFIKDALKNANFEFLKLDLLDPDGLSAAFKGDKPMARAL